MTREETIKLLAIVRANYPNVKISDPAATVSAWEMSLGGFTADSVMKAVKLHMATSKFFPTPADIIEKMVRSELVYREPPRTALPQRAKVTAIPDGMSFDEFIDCLCEDMAKLDEECQPDEPQDSDMSNSLPFEI